jgi:phytoene dehydrogenase-like protein
MATYDIIIIGGGHNGLVAATYLAKAGLRVIVLERREIVGGAAITEGLHPGFHCSTLAHAVGPLLPRVIKDLQLQRHGLEFIEPAVRVTALHPDGRSLSLYNDPERTFSNLDKISPHDAKSFGEFESCMARLGKLLAPLLSMTPPTIEKPTTGELWNLGKLGLKFRGLSKKDSFRLLRWGPMAVADLVAEWFETELLRATIAARGIYGSFAGPWSAGTSTGLLWQAALSGQALGAAAQVKGGLGGVSRALGSAALEAGVELRTGAAVAEIRISEGKAVGVVLAGGEELTARAVVSNADPRTTFLKLIDPVNFDPDFLGKIRNYRSLGSVAKVNLALSALPEFSALKGTDATERLSGRIHIGPDIDYLERAFDAAKYGDFSPRPYLDVTIPSLLDSALAPKGAHVMSINVQFAPYKLKTGDWNTSREDLGDTVVNLLSEYAPNLKELIVRRQVITPLDLEQIYGLSGGHIFHGEQTLDQFFVFRPLIGWAQYRTPIKGLYLCGAGTHPGGGVTGGPGANASHVIIKDFSRARN